MADVGELVVGAWLTQVEGYDFVVYNQRPGRELPESVAPSGPDGVSARLAELDVIGLHTPGRRAYLAEVTTHLDGLLYGSGNDGSVAKLRRKFAVSAAYASVLESRTELSAQLALWSPRVSTAVIARGDELASAAGRPVEIIANASYAERVGQLVDLASKGTTTTGNDFFRTLQLLTHLAKPGLPWLPTPTAKRAKEAVAALTAPVVLPWREVVKVHRTQAGIRAPRGGTEASIICNTGTHGPYPDRFLGDDVLQYVGRGFDGDQVMDRDNESLRLAVERGIPVRVFEQLSKNRYLDHGAWEGVGEPLWHLDPAHNRRLIVFTFRRLAGG